MADSSLVTIRRLRPPRSRLRPDLPPVDLTDEERARLEAAEARVGTFQPRRGLPGPTRASCVGGQRPCPWVACTMHLWRQDETPGRPHPGVDTAPSLYPRWLEDPVPPSCALDVAATGGKPAAVVGPLMSVTRRRAEQILREAVEARGDVDRIELEDPRDSLPSALAAL